MDLLQSAINEIKRDILSNKDFMRSILKDVRLTKENVDPNLIYSLMSEFATNQQPPRPKSNAPKELATGKGIAKPIAMGDDSLESKVVADLLVGNNVYLYGKAGSGKTYAAKAIASSVMGQKIFTINCSQWTSPVQILGGQTIKGYQEGELIKAWAQGGIFIPDEMPKLDPNTAGLLNDALAETAAQPKYNDDGTVDEATIPYIVNGRGDKVYKGQDQTDPDLKFRFGVIATGNTDLITVGNKYAGNQKQDYSLVDRFAGSMYLLDYNPSTEMRLTYPYVYNIAIAMRKFLDARDSVQSISLRTMLNFNRTYEQEQLFKMNSPFADDIRDNLGNPIQPKSLDNSIDSFLEIMDKVKRNELMDDNDFRNARNSSDNNMDTFIAHFKARYHKDPVTGEKVTTVSEVRPRGKR